MTRFGSTAWTFATDKVLQVLFWLRAPSQAVPKNIIIAPQFVSAGAIAVLLAGAMSLGSARADSPAVELSETGTDLGRIEVTEGQVSDLRFTVDLNGDVPTGTYVWATLDSARRRQRTNSGYWLAWNGDLDKLINNQFPVVDGKVQFKILDETLSEYAHGIDINIGYQVGEILKYGRLALAPSKLAE